MSHLDNWIHNISTQHLIDYVIYLPNISEFNISSIFPQSFLDNQISKGDIINIKSIYPKINFGYRNEVKFVARQTVIQKKADNPSSNDSCNCIVC